MGSGSHVGGHRGNHAGIWGAILDCRRTGHRILLPSLHDFASVYGPPPSLQPSSPLLFSFQMRLMRGRRKTRAQSWPEVENSAISDGKGGTVRAQCDCFQFWLKYCIYEVMDHYISLTSVQRWNESFLQQTWSRICRVNDGLPRLSNDLQNL
jgi:hypothetical protein